MVTVCTAVTKGFVQGATSKSRRRCSLVLAHSSVVLSVALHAPNAMAAEWLAEPLVRVAGGYDDNVRLAADDETDAYIGVVTAGVAWRRATETLRVGGAARLDYRTYAGSGEDLPEDEDGQLLELELAHTRPSGLWHLDAAYRRDTTTLDADAADLAEAPGRDLDPGLAEESVRRNRLYLNPVWEQEVSPRVGVGLGYTGIRLSYGADGENRLYDSWTHQAGGFMRYAVSERTIAAARLEHILFRSDDAADIDANLLAASVEHEWSLRTELEAMAGVTTAEPRRGDAGSEVGFAGRVQVRHEMETGEVHALLEQQLLPSGSGVLEEVRQLLLGWEHAISPVDRLGLELRAFQARAVTDAVDGDDRDFLRISPAWTHEFSPSWALRLSYGYRWVEEREEGSSADGNLLLLQLDYRPGRGLF